MIKLLKRLFSKKYKPVDFIMFDCKKVDKNTKKNYDWKWIKGYGKVIIK